MEKYRKINGGTYTGERALFMLANASISEATFCDGESPLKESVNIDIDKCTFDWKYPIWYAKNIVVTDLICNSESYDVKVNKISYFVDSATRE